MSQASLTTVEESAYPLGPPDLDRDVIIAGEWLKTITCAGLDRAAVATLRAGGESACDDLTQAGAPILGVRSRAGSSASTT